MSKFNRRGRLLILLIIVSLVLQGSYTATGDELPQGGKYGGTLKVALKSEIMNLNPLTVTDSQVWKVIDIVYDSLFRLKTAVNGSIFPEPWLTESWEVLDNNTVVVELKQGVMWHDSTDVLPHYVTADDVIYTFTSSGGMKDSTKYGTMLTGISAFKTSPTNDYSVTFDLTNFDNKGIFFTRVLTVPLIPFGFGSTEFERGCGPFKYFSLVSAPNAVTDEILISGALGDEPRASLRHRNVSGVVVRLDSSVWPSSNYILHSRSGVVEFVTSPPVTSNITADYQYVDNRLVLEAFEDYHNGRPYLNNIEYTFYIDDPSSEYFDEGVDQAVIELIRKDVDLIGFEIGPADVSADRYYYDEDEGVSIKTKLSDETWKLVESFDNRTYDDPLTTPDEAEAAAYAYMRGFPKRTLKKVMIWTVEENITGEWTVVAIFDSEYECEQYKAGEIEDHPEKDGKLRTTFVWDVVEFFLALEETAGFNVLYLGINTQAVPLNDRQFRFALANLMDRNTQLSLLGTGRDTGYSIMIPEDSYWYNDSIPTYKLERNKENQPVYDNVSQVLMQAGYHDVAGAPFGGSDGYMDLPTGQVFSLNLLIPPIDLNSVESSIGSTIFQQLNGIGINTSVQQATFDEIMENVSADTFDLALGILETDIDPYFLFDLFHSSKSGTGPSFPNLNNYVPIELIVNETLNDNDIKLPGDDIANLTKTNLQVSSEIVYRNDLEWDNFMGLNYTIDYNQGTLEVRDLTFNSADEYLNITYEYRQFDHLLKMMDDALQFGIRQSYVREILGLVAEDVPMIPLVYYNVLEAYDRTVYDGWVKMPGGVNNFWSYINLQYIITGSLTIDVSSVVTALSSNSTAMIIVTAKDEEGVGIENVYISLSEELDRGVISDLTGYTDNNGIFQTTYRAPTVTYVTDVNIKAIGIAERYEDEALDMPYYFFEDETSITVYPQINEFIVNIARADLTMPSGNETTVTVLVQDKVTLLPIQNATVKLEVTPEGLDTRTALSEGETDALGMFATTFSANVTTETFFKITSKVSMTGFEPSQRSTSIKITVEYVPVDGQDYMLEISLAILIVVLVVLLLIVSLLGTGKKPKVKASKEGAEESPEEPTKVEEEAPAEAEEPAEEASEAEESIEDGAEEEEPAKPEKKSRWGRKKKK